MHIKKIIYENKSYCIYLSNDESFVISEPVFVRYNLYKGKEIFEEEILDIKKNHENQKAIDFILPKIRNRKTSYEIKTLLKREGFTLANIEFAIEFLEKYNFIDDDEYAKLFVRDKARLNKYGPIKIKYLLQQKGISKFIISHALKEYDQEAMYKNIESLLKKKFKASHLSESKNRNKCIRFFLQKGYKLDDILHILDRSME